MANIIQVKKKVKKRTFDDTARSYVENLFGVSGSGTFDPTLVADDFDATSLIDKYESDLDLVSLVEKSVDPLTGIPRDISIPEGDFKEANSFFDYCLNFRGSDSKFPFSRQMWLMLMMFGEVCPRCTPKRMFNIHNLPVDDNPRNIGDRMQLLQYGVCPRCAGTKSEFFRKGELNEYYEMSLCIGQRAGKSTTSAAGTEYLLHKYLMYPKMSTICQGISASTPLTATFVGFRFADAYNLLWTPILNGIKESQWFVGFNQMLTDVGNQKGVELLALKDSFLKYRHKNLELAPSGPTKRGLRGRTRWLTIIDELGWFPVRDEENDERENADANGTYEALDRSLLTLRTEMSTLYQKGHNRFLQGYALNISSPSSQGDKINRLVEENKESKTSLAMRLATWEVSPLFTRDNKIIAEAYRKDAVVAERDYGANPPLNASIFIQKEEALRAFVGKNLATVEEIAKNINSKWRQAGRIATSAPPNPTPASLLSLDAGLTNNSFAITILNLIESKINGVSTVTINVPVVLEVMPKPGHMLHYPLIYKFLLKPLIEQFNVRFMFADRWNSITTLDTAADDFANVNLIAKQYSVKYNDFITTRSYIEEGKMVLPRLEIDPDNILRVADYPFSFRGQPAAHLLFQMITVRDRGKTVVKGEGFTDDLFRALVLGTSRILDDKIKPEILAMSAASTRGRMTGAVSVGRSGSLGSMGMGGMSPRSTAVINASRASLLNAERNVHRGNTHIVRVGRN